MKSIFDKLFYIGIATTICVWGVALCSLWTRVFGSRGPDLWVSGGVSLGVFAVGLSAPGRFFRVLQWAASRLLPGSWVTRSRGGVKADVAQLSQLLGIALIIAAGASLASALCVLAAEKMVLAFSSQFLLPGWAFRMMQVAVESAGMLPWGLGAALVWHLLRLVGDGQPGHDGRRAHEDWLWGGAVAASVLALTWQLLWDPLVIGLLAGAGQLICGVTLVRRRPLPGRHEPGEGGPTLGPGVRTHVGVIGRAAAMSLVLTLQLRCLTDLCGASLPVQGLAMAGSLALAAWFYRRWVGAIQTLAGPAVAGAAVLVVVAVAVQLALGWVSVAGGEGMRWAVYLAMAAQTPLIAGATAVVVAHRGRFLHEGGSVRRWMQWSLLGAAAGMLAGSLWSGPVGATLGLVTLLACLAGAVLVGLRSFERAREGLSWTVAGAVLLLGVTGALTRSASRAARRPGMAVSFGTWLTAWQYGRQCGYFPLPERQPGWRLDLAAGKLVAVALDAGQAREDGQATLLAEMIPRGEWLIVTRRPVLDVGSGSPPPAAFSAADPALLTLPTWERRRAKTPWHHARTGPFQFNGVFYAPMRANHPAARSVFHAAALRAAEGRLGRDGLLIVHLPCPDGDAAAALAIARTIHQRLGEAVVAVAPTDGGVEFLVFRWPDASEGQLDALVKALTEYLPEPVRVIRSYALAAQWGSVRTIDRRVGPRCGAEATVTAGTLWQRLSPAGADADSTDYLGIWPPR